jgi:hypothetical protein
MPGMAGKQGKEAQQTNPRMSTAWHATPTRGFTARAPFGNPALKASTCWPRRSSVRATTRENCGKCHFDGGGGNGVKHGDLDESLYFPEQALDVHMGGTHNLQCSDCHVTRQHQILGRIIADNYQIDPAEQVSCEQCHTGKIHSDQRIATHLAAVACQTCHIPAIAREEPTKVTWDWSKAGQTGREDDHYDLPEDQGRVHLRGELRTHLRLVQRRQRISLPAGRQDRQRRADLHQQAGRRHPGPAREDLPVQGAHRAPALRHRAPPSAAAGDLR